MLRALQRLGRAVLVAGLLVCAGALTSQAKTTLHWYGQAAWKITTPNGGVILIDPWLTVPTNPDKHSIDELKRVDYILITHAHRDHVGDAVQIAKKTGAILVTSYGLKSNMVSMLGYPAKQAPFNYSGNIGGTIDLPKVGAKALIVNALHGSELTPPTIPNPKPGEPGAITSGNPIGFVITIKGGPTIYHTGDTDVYTDMKLIPMFNHVDVMLACIGGFFTMDPVRAALAVDWVKPTHVIPMHYGTFPLLAGTPAEFHKALEKYHMADRMIDMKPGDTRTF